MKQSGWYCNNCEQELLYYNIGFDDGYQCPKCKRILESYQLKKEAIKATDIYKRGVFAYITQHWNKTI